MAALAGLGTALTIGSAVIGAGAAVYSAVSSVQQGQAQQAEFERQAQVDELTGKNEYAASQRVAQEKALEGQLIQSRQIAYAAASGAGTGANDPTLVKIMSDTGSRTKYAVDSTLYQGQSARDAYDSSATARRRTGQATFLGGVLDAVGTLAGGVGHLADTTARFIPSPTPRSASSAWGWGSIPA